jgi:hypothetical protein
VSSAQERIENWPAPGLWSPPARAVAKGGLAPLEAEAIEAVPTPPLHFVGITPCRLVDTRGNGFTGAYGPPALPQGVPRNFVLTGRCGISPTAQAVSLNVTVTNTQGPGFILIYPAGGAQPTVSTLNYVAGQTIANAAVVPLGTGGAITVIAGVSGADLILDTNGDYRGEVVTAINGVTGNVTFESASGTISIDPDGQTFSFDVFGGANALLPSGTTNQTLRHDGFKWVPSSAVKNNEFGLELTGILELPSNASIWADGSRFLYTQLNGGSWNTYIGVGAAAQGIGVDEVGVGYYSLGGGLPSGRESNIGIGTYSLFDTTSGDFNVAIGHSALGNMTTGSGNIGIGRDAGVNNTTGSNNIYIGNLGSAGESGQIRIGSGANITQGTVIVGIYGFGSSGGIPVIVNSGGRLGTTTSSVRVKEDVRDIGAESDGLMSLRPVAFKYKASHEPGRLPQYGLIAEEVAEVYPELVVNDDEGRPFAIRSQLLDPLLLNELQKQHHSIEAQRIEIEELKTQLAKLAARMDMDPRD